MNKTYLNVSSLFPIISCFLLTYSSSALADYKIGRTHLTASEYPQTYNLDRGCQLQWGKTYLANVGNATCIPNTGACELINLTTYHPGLKGNNYVVYSLIYPGFDQPFNIEYKCYAMS